MASPSEAKGAFVKGSGGRQRRRPNKEKPVVTPVVSVPPVLPQEPASPLQSPTNTIPETEISAWESLLRPFVLNKIESAEEKTPGGSSEVLSCFSFQLCRVIFLTLVCMKVSYL